MNILNEKEQMFLVKNEYLNILLLVYSTTVISYNNYLY